MTNVNTELFRRTAPVKKMEIIKDMTQDELLSISKETILRIVKETGRRVTGSRNYEFYVHPGRRKGNDWNSIIEGIWLYKGKLSIITYIQVDDDAAASIIVPFNDFFKEGAFRGSVRSEDFYGNIQTNYFGYGKRAKAEVIRSFCIEFIYIKYKSKFSEKYKLEFEI